MGLLQELRQFFDSSNNSADEDLERVQELIGYHFRSPELLRLGLTHRSFTHSNNRRESSNERLEFLGDSVLGLVIADALYQDHPDLREGELTKTKALLVNETTLASIGKDIGLNKSIKLAPEEAKSGGADRPSIISDAFEGVLGAVFLDGGLDPVRDVILRLIYARKDSLISDESQRNFKGELLELMQAAGKSAPRYDVLSEDGPDHRKMFNVVVFSGQDRLGSGSGPSKKDAEQKAAAMALAVLEE
jgi:ribonuclease-3